jgi:hypothetical protein
MSFGAAPQIPPNQRAGSPEIDLAGKLSTGASCASQ